MNTVNLLIANTSGSLDKIVGDIKDSFRQAKLSCESKISINGVDIIVVDAPYNVIPELGVGGYTPAQNLIYISIDPSHDIKKDDIYTTMLHELHHAARWSKPGYGYTLKEALLSEGLAALFEEEVTGNTPIYVKGPITKKQISSTEEYLESSNYNHFEWFIAGNEFIPRWFGYAYGYILAKEAVSKRGMSASELVHSPITDLI